MSKGQNAKNVPFDRMKWKGHSPPMEVVLARLSDGGVVRAQEGEERLLNGQVPFAAKAVARLRYSLIDSPRIPTGED